VKQNPTENRRGRPVFILAVGVGTLILSVQANAQAASPFHSAASRYSSAVSNALSESSVTWTSKIAGPAHAGTFSFTSVAGVSSGRQHIDLSNGMSGHLDVVLSNGVVYAKGDQGGLALALGLTDEAAKQEVNTWISIQPSSSIYANQAEGLTIKSVVAGLALSGPFTSEPPRKVDGQLALAVRGMTTPMPSYPSVPGVLYVSDQRNPLPIHEIERSKESTFTIAYSHWGSPIVVKPPPASVPLQASWVES
jgi:hypothetical protein